MECFNLMRHIIGGVDYKGVREIMKGCREKAQTLPIRLDTGNLPQLKALQNVIEYIFDRNASLLPGYFIVTEIQKAYPESTNWPHWVSIFYIITSLARKLIFKIIFSNWQNY